LCVLLIFVKPAGLRKDHIDFLMYFLGRSCYRPPNALSSRQSAATRDPRLLLGIQAGDTSESSTIHPQRQPGTIIPYPPKCHPERSEGSAVVFETFKLVSLPDGRQFNPNGRNGAARLYNPSR